MFLQRGHLKCFKLAYGLPCWPSGQESACIPGMQVQSLGWGDPLEEEMATHSIISARKIPWTKETDRLQPIGMQRVRCN